MSDNEGPPSPNCAERVRVLSYTEKTNDNTQSFEGVDVDTQQTASQLGQEKFFLQ